MFRKNWLMPDYLAILICLVAGVLCGGFMLVGDDGHPRQGENPEAPALEEADKVLEAIIG